MSTAAAGWLVLAAIVLAWAAPSPALVRADRLGGVERLAAPPRRGWVRPAVAGDPRFLTGLAGSVVVALVVTAGAAAAVAAAAVLGVAALLLRDRRVAARDRVHDAALLVGLDVIVGELAAGAQPAGALAAAAEVTGPLGPVFERAAASAAEGGDASAALLGEPRTEILGVAWEVGRDGGSALAGVLQRVAGDLRAGAEQRQAVQVALSGPRSSAALLAGLPLLGIGLGVAMGADPVEFLTGSGAGRLVACVGVVLDASGIVWMRRILRRAGGR